jgi:hypothetical protein
MRFRVVGVWLIVRFSILRLWIRGSGWGVLFSFCSEEHHRGFHGRFAFKSWLRRLAYLYVDLGRMVYIRGRF